MSLEVQWNKDDDIKKIPNDVESPLKNMIVDYVGAQNDPENGQVTIDMILDSLIKEFPELVYVLAEENWIRGYEQGLQDMDNFGEE